MKKFTKILLVSVLGLTTLFGQENHIGIKAGLQRTVTPNHFANSEDDAYVTSFYGFYYRHHLNEKWQIQPELVMNNIKFGATENDRDLKYYRRIKQIQLPIIIRYNLANKLFFEGGPGVGFNMGNPVSYTYNLGTTSRVEEEEVWDKFNLYYNLGLAYDFENGTSIGLRYQKSINNTLDLPNDEDRGEADQKDPRYLQQVQLSVNIPIYFLSGGGESKKYNGR